ncbi:MAG: hypothetical protein M5U12_29785 [Verrucomicrobia bacterium]|nr:hypothetical protein [Verrucomicrobiota bacterium]
MAEISVLIGAWQSLPLAVGVTGIGIVLGVAYLLRAMQHGFFAGGEVEQISHSGSPAPPLPPISWPEKVGAGLLLLTTVVIGLFPRLLLDYIVPSVQPLVSAWKQGGGS